MTEQMIRQTEALARAAAATFHEEFPGQTPEDEWDAQAWEMDAHNLGPDAEAHLEELWDVYHDTFHAEVQRLNAQPTGQSA